ncbi:Autophagy-related protein 2 [Leucoagaricus sp. SymC.cos]|nr:Autophagy-related protein 2 [Leucoagaricus sp. SymC.cos]
MSWFSAWLPQFPAFNVNFALPTSIQGRFLSFVLKKTLGHFFKHGQLDAGQIDSQIGSGFVQVKDLELDNGAINSILSRISLTLTSGTLSSATVRIPWPNPLTSNLGFSINSLHLTFEVTSATAPPLSTDLASSVASVAESFLHEELTPREEASLLDSLHSEFPGALADVERDVVPGGLDPFEVGSSDEPRTEMEPGGISLFATLIERLLARFEFDAHDVQITIIHPDNISITLVLSDVNYTTSTKESPSIPDPSSGVTRSLTMNGVLLKMKDLRTGDTRLTELKASSSPKSLKNSDLPCPVYQAESPNSSSSSLDEETTMAMSQSLATLPPRPSSPYSAASSMYQSALSVVKEEPGHASEASTAPDFTTHHQSCDNSVAFDTVFSSGSFPITIQLVTLPPSNDSDVPSPGQGDRMIFSLKAGLLTCAFRPWHIRGLLCLSEALVSSSAPPKLQSSKKDSSTSDGGLSAFDIEGSARARGFVLLLLPSHSDVSSGDLEQIFLHPLVPPLLPSGYMRLHVQGVFSSFSLPSQASSNPRRRPREGVGADTSLQMSGSLSVHNVSLFGFRPGGSNGLVAFPVAFTDPYLPNQYPSSHIHPSELDGSLDTPLPEFDIIDWTAPDHQQKGAARLSYWRCKPKVRQQTHRPNPGHSISPSQTTQMENAPIHGPDEDVLSVKFHKKGKRNGSSHFTVEGTVMPLHVLIDLETIIGDDTVVQFFEEATQGLTNFGGTASADAFYPDQYNLDDTPPTTPRVSHASSQEREKTRLERMVLRDLDLEYDYGDIRGETRYEEFHVKAKGEIHISMKITALRLELRVPPPSSIPRSGALIIDIHTLEIRNGLKQVESHTRFATSTSDIPSSNAAESQPIISADCNRILVVEAIDQPTPLRPRFSVIKSRASSSTITALNIELPSAHVIVSKPALDGLQYFIDDASQLLETFSQRTARAAEETAEGGDNSLIGSRFFSKSRSNSGSALMKSSNGSSSETVVKVVMSEAFVRAWVPRNDTGTISTRPFDVFASEFNILVELKPEGKDETVITLGLLDAKVTNVFKNGKTESLVQLTAPRSLVVFTRVFVSLVTFEAVIPSERTSIVLKVMDGSVRVYAPTKPGAIILYVGDTDLSTEIAGNSLESTVSLGIQYLSLLAIDDTSIVEGEISGLHDTKGVSYWKSLGYALVAEIAETNAVVSVTKSPPIHVDLVVDGIQLHLHLAADTLSSLAALINDIASTFKPPDEEVLQELREPFVLSETSASRNLMSSVEDVAFQRLPEIGPAPDMISDDLPTNPEYLDESFGAAAGLREFSDDELDDLEDDVDGGSEVKHILFEEVEPGCTSNHNGETIKVHNEGINMIEEYYDNLPAELSESPVGEIESKLKIRVRGGEAILFLYDGYDWARTRKIIEEEVKEMRRRLAKIRQLVAHGQVQESDVEEANAVLFNSVYIGIDQDIDMTEPGALLAAIDEELKDDLETATQSSWQSLRPTGTPVSMPGKQRARAPKVHGKKLARSKGPSMEFKLMGLNADMDQFFPDEILVSKTFVTVRDVEILDHIKTSTWKKFLTSLRSDSRGNIRETDSDMVRVELRGVRPSPGHPSEEARLRAKILPLRLYVDQDAVDFLKRFFSFKDPHEAPATGKPAPEAYIQLAEVFPVDLKLDYKPRRVDYRALREGRTIELMNFFHFDGAEMTLRHITLAGITGWPRLFEMLNDLWTPDVKATQLVDVISGVSPIRSMVNVGSGVADLVLLPISQYKKDGRIVRGLQKGATAFVKSTAIEAIKMGARLATGTQVILEQAESVLGGQFSDSYMTESLQVSTLDEAGRLSDDFDDEVGSDLISKYAEQPADIREGVQSAYRSLRQNLNSAAQTILAVPMEVYEKSGSEGPVRSVVRAVPIAVLKPMIGASEAISKTLLGLHNTLDPNVQRENEAKYKHR